MKKLIVALTVSLLVIVVVWLVVVGRSEQHAGNTGLERFSGSADSEQASAPDLVIGQPDAQLTIVEYGDFKCPNCSRFHQQAGADIKRDYVDSGKVKVVFRNLPFIAPDSTVAAQGAYCANDQGQFSQYYDLLFNHIWSEYYGSGNTNEGKASEIFNEANLTNLVSAIGVETDEFNDCLKSNKYSGAVESDSFHAQQDGAAGTPTVVIDGQPVVGNQPYSIYKQLIDAKL